MSTRLLVIFSGLLMAGVLAMHSTLMGDSIAVVRGAQAILECTSHGRWTGCSAVDQWPIFQFIPSLLLLSAGVGVKTTGMCLAWLNIAALGGLCVLAIRTFKGQPILGWVTVLALLGGPYLAYSNQSFGEVLAGFLTALFVVAWMRRSRGWVVGLAIFFAAITKETSFPYLVLLGTLCVLAPWERGVRWGELLRAERGRLFGAVMGLVPAAACTAALNVFRYSSLLNTNYLKQAAWGPSLPVGAELAVAQWVSPNVGLLFFWPAFVALLVAALWVGRRADRKGRLAVWGVWIFLALVCVGLSRWWAPFGWWAWGSRLILPWLPASLLVALHARAHVLEPFLERVVAPALRRTVLVTAVTLLGVPHLIDTVHAHALNMATFAERGVCPVPSSESARIRYWNCIRAQTWIYESPLRKAWERTPYPESLMPEAIYLVTAGLVGLHLGWLTRRKEAEAAAPDATTG